MSEQPGRFERELASRGDPAGEEPPGMPRWVKVSAVVVVVLVALLVTVHLLTGGGPGHHMPVGIGAGQGAWVDVGAPASGLGTAGWRLG